MKSLCSLTRHLPSLLRCSSHYLLLFDLGPVPLPLHSPLLFVRNFKSCGPRPIAEDDTTAEQYANHSKSLRLLTMAVNEYNNDNCCRTSRPHLPYTVFIEGNIGSGKTTFLEQFADCPNVYMAKEPVHKWQDVCGHNFLGLMYQDPKRWSFAFQSIVQRTMLELHQALPEHGQNIKIMERSIYSARNIFIENLYKDNLMASPEYAVLDAWYKWIIENVKIECDLIIYLRTDPEVAFQRIKTRNRFEEKDVTLDYIQHLHELHDKWLNVHKTDVPKSVPVVIVDANQSMEQVKKQFKGVRELINKNATALIEPKTTHKISDLGKTINEIQHNIVPNCTLVPDVNIIRA
ncbi:P-loop containing nucleoside triphosphate hydrolase,Deoxynucleoside kinase domain [Cinara cedri]|uniref:P-loop containing nucleoside triphosphate hydrolase,Deoxynucleoside kinase domain n=1 Tax=Cinara cedri TaxID=506608 RepID=A0A5E4N2D0_9HEMI|nr:P-loop containing nucleoside triphosphate hydrolase,Deoxynucleoside kinase domain [Cinara cedri]